MFSSCLVWAWVCRWLQLYFVIAWKGDKGDGDGEEYVSRFQLLLRVDFGDDGIGVPVSRITFTVLPL